MLLLTIITTDNARQLANHVAPLIGTTPELDAHALANVVDTFTWDPSAVSAIERGDTLVLRAAADVDGMTWEELLDDLHYFDRVVFDDMNGGEWPLSWEEGELGLTAVVDHADA